MDRKSKNRINNVNELCEALSECSFEIKRWLTKQPEVKEETLTDWFLYNLSEKIPAIKYKQFTRSEEGRKTGADWEWWFVFSKSKSLAIRVQAKKIKLSVDNYPGIAYTKNGKLQIERLLDDSVKDGFASFYAIYSAEIGPSMCGLKNGGGMFFAEANKIRNEFILKPRRMLKPVDILQFANPISCLFCCPFTNQRDIEDGFRRYMQHYFPTFSVSSNAQQDNNNLGFRATPNYILQLLNSETLQEQWEAEYQTYIEKSNAIVVVDLRNLNTEFQE